MDDNMKVLHELLKEVREDQKKHGEELVKQGVTLDKVEGNVSKNTEDLAEHMRRTDILEDLHKDNQEKIKFNNKRIEVLEEPDKAAAYFKRRWKVYTGMVIGVLTIASLVAKIAGVF